MRASRGESIESDKRGESLGVRGPDETRDSRGDSPELVFDESKPATGVGRACKRVPSTARSATPPTEADLWATRCLRGGEGGECRALGGDISPEGSFGGEPGVLRNAEATGLPDSVTEPRESELDLEVRMAARTTAGRGLGGTIGEATSRGDELLSLDTRSRSISGEGLAE
jgi:hypothetical protein